MLCYAMLCYVMSCHVMSCYKEKFKVMFFVSLMALRRWNLPFLFYFVYLFLSLDNCNVLTFIRLMCSIELRKSESWYRTELNIKQGKGNLHCMSDHLIVFYMELT